MNWCFGILWIYSQQWIHSHQWSHIPSYCFDSPHYSFIHPNSGQTWVWFSSLWISLHFIEFYYMESCSLYSGSLAFFPKLFRHLSMLCVSVGFSFLLLDNIQSCECEGLNVYVPPTPKFIHWNTTPILLFDGVRRWEFGRSLGSGETMGAESSWIGLVFW